MSDHLREELLTVEYDNQRIYGMVHLPEAPDGPVPGVMLLHGFTGSSTSDNRILVRQARQLADAGIAALRFDFRGSGQSEGQFADVTISGEIGDAMRMLEVLASHPGIDPSRLGVLGLSMGGAVAACLLSRADYLRALVLWSPVAAPDDLLRRFAAAAGIEPDPESGQADAFGEIINPGFIMELPLITPIESVRSSQVPVLVVHATHDRTVPIDEGQAYIEAAGGPRRMIAIEDADHTFQSARWRAELYAETTAWFRQYL